LDGQRVADLEVKGRHVSTTEAAFLSLLFAGIVVLLTGLVLTRLHWRPELPPYGRGTRVLHVTFHPEAYVKDAPLRAIRNLNFTGAALLAGAFAVVAYEIVRIMLA
jgi:hypothetical protein